ncbi:MAG: ABC transporter substrate-binding protein, partial [Bdellovibrionales bacterium]|nr:ABC transporter substrate-binding protein [Bdellovibrionales bacterium]
YDNLVYTFQLKPYIFFHNGDLLTKEDILFSIDEFKKPASPFSPMMSVIKKAEAEYGPEGGWVKLYLKKFSAPFLTDLASIKLLSKKEITQAGDQFYRKPVGSGVFAFLKRDQKNIFLQSHKKFFGDKSRSEFVQFKVIKDDNTRFQKVYKGKIDIVQADVPFSKIKIFEKLENFNVVVEPGLSVTYLLLNLRDEKLKDPKVRRAIHSAISRKDLIEYSFEGLADPATSIVSTLSPFHNHQLKDERYNPEQIKSIFSLLKNEKLIFKSSNKSTTVEKGKIISHQLRKYGLDVEQQSYEWGTYYEDIITGKFQMALMKWVGIVDPDIYRVSLHSEMTPPGRNRGHYSNKEFDNLVSQALVEPDFSRRKRLYDKAQAIVFKDLPTIPLWYEKQVAIIHKRVKNYSLPTTGNFSSLVKAYKEENGN